MFSAFNFSFGDGDFNIKKNLNFRWWQN